jgi:hypothetical protein
MARKPAEIVNGYKGPGGRGGAAVAKACQLIIQNPGIKQGDVLDTVAYWAKLNHSTANWITSPGSKSPAELLWSRQKVGRAFGCFPNEHTHLLGDPRLRLRAEVIREFDGDWKAVGSPNPGDLVSYFRPRWDEHSKQDVELALLVSFVKTTHRGSVYKEEQVFSRSHLDDLDNYTEGSFWLTPQIKIDGALHAVPMPRIRKEAA